MKNRLFLVLALLLCSLPIRAQWSGGLDLSGGFGVMSGSMIDEEKPMYHGLAKGTFNLNYKAETFDWGVKVFGDWKPLETDNARMEYKNNLLDVVYKKTSTKPLTVGVKSDFEWRPSAAAKYSAWIQYKYKHDNASNISLDLVGDEEDMKSFAYYFEKPMLNEHKVETGFKSFNSFASGRHVLRSSLSMEFDHSQKVNSWDVLKSEDDGSQGGGVAFESIYNGFVWEYKLTPSSTDLNLKGDINLENTILDGGSKLKLTPGVRFTNNHSLDQNSGATLITKSVIDGDHLSTVEEWRDSTRLRENFNYISLSVDNYLVADFNWKNLEAHADYALQVYARRLNDDDHYQRLRVKGLYPVGSANIKWNITPHHALNLRNKISVKHPEYLMICWYDRTAGYMDQLYRGNEELLSPQTFLYALDYEFNWGRFVAKSSISYKEVNNEIDQTWKNEEIDGRLYKVFIWVNSADSRSAGLSQTLGWHGKVINANAGITYNQSSRTSKSTGAVKNSFDWKLTGDITANLGKGWSVGMDAKYQSKVATFFTIFKEYCELNAKVQKEFKHITLYLEGHDLLDQPREKSFTSEELQELWIDQVRSNRRIVILGAKWNF